MNEDSNKIKRTTGAFYRDRINTSKPTNPQLTIESKSRITSDCPGGAMKTSLLCFQYIKQYVQKIVPKVDNIFWIFCIIPLFCVKMAFFFNCAGQFPPPGGPLDTTPPEIVKSDPESGSLYFNNNQIIVEFSEYVDHRSAQEAIFVSPSLGPLEFNWSGKKLEINFSEKLRENTTYILTVGTDVKDRRNNNQMVETFSLAFSTGGTIDSASISGKVYDDKPFGVSIFAYKLNNIDPDTLNPAFQKPDHITQTGKDGSFIMPYLSYGNYRLFAVMDEYRNLLYDTQVDQYGVAYSDIILSPDQSYVDNVKFQLTIEDTTSPFIVNASANDKNSVLVRFSEPIDIQSLDSFTISIIDTFTLNELPLRSVNFLSPFYHSLILETGVQDTVIYKLTIEGCKDTAGNEISKINNFAFFFGSAEVDTSIPIVNILNLKNNEKNILYSQNIDIAFNEPIDKSAFEKGFSLIDSNKINVDGKFLWINDISVSFRPTKNLENLMQYQVQIILDSVYDAAGNAFRDSVYSLQFETIDQKKLSLIRGSVVNESNEGMKGPILITAKNISSSPVFQTTKRLNDFGQFELVDVVEGTYVLKIFEDENLNNKYENGKIFPYQFNERFVFYPDTIKVRARWPVDGINIRFK